ncbi:baseplate J/gp47 family protein [Azospirillum doebereinerae]|uniref:baseplate assembly protein n=1 Tax=Azospirillum doebereinerae TaxID=92933 RepID=UPI001EE5A216|nr:baseplate J/gp47 family protein [Azospirillum doebereinerae]MCG5240095.1 baseplate J/gp47 family protein [Azospirillum doebereinerae]
MTTAIDLSRLAPPAIIEPLSFEAILAEMRADLKVRYPDWTASELESDPANKLLEVAAYRELTVRQRVNDAVRAGLLAFAGGADLDHLAAFYGVQRNAGESDAALRLRVQNRIQGWANAGGAAHYRYWALSASADVRDAAVSSPSPGLVRVAVLSRVGTGAPTPALLDAVRATVLRDDVRVLTDTVEVVAATVQPVDIIARVWLYPETPTEVFSQAVAALPATMEAARGLGWDLTRSWLIAQLHLGGVHRVELAAPVADVSCGDAACVALGTVSITLEGRAR